jgi:hypothetical protein
VPHRPARRKQQHISLEKPNNSMMMKPLNEAEDFERGVLVNPITKLGKNKTRESSSPRIKHAQTAHLHPLIVPLPLGAQLLCQRLVARQVSRGRLLEARVSGPRKVPRLISQLPIRPSDGISSLQPGGWRLPSGGPPGEAAPARGGGVITPAVGRVLGSGLSDGGGKVLDVGLPERGR